MSLLSDHISDYNEGPDEHVEKHHKEPKPKENEDYASQNLK